MYVVKGRNCGWEGDGGSILYDLGRRSVPITDPAEIVLCVA